MKKLLALLLFAASNVFAADVTVTDSSCPRWSATILPNGSMIATCGQVATLTPTCSISVNPATITVGDAACFTTSCSPTPTSYTVNGVTTNASPTCVTPTVTTTYSLIGNVANAIVTVNQPASPVNASCDTSKTRSSVNSQTQYVGAGITAAYSFVAGTDSNAVQLQYPSGTIYMDISTAPCDYSTAVPGACKGGGSVAPVINYTASDPRMCILTPGVTYYFNVKMYDGSAGSFMVF